MKKSVLAAIALVLSASLAPATAQTTPDPIPIPQQAGAEQVSAYLGHPAAPHPVAALPVPENPFLSPGSWSNMHDDTYMSDTYPTPAARSVAVPWSPPRSSAAPRHRSDSSSG
jgi:hypothetical protein